MVKLDNLHSESVNVSAFCTRVFLFLVSSGLFLNEEVCHAAHDVS